MNKLFKSLILVFGILFLLSAGYYYLFGNFKAGADAPLDFLSRSSLHNFPATGECPECVKLVYNDDVYPAVRQPINITIIKEALNRKGLNDIALFEVSIENDTETGSNIIFSPSLQEGTSKKEWSDKQTAQVTSLGQEEDMLVSFVIKGPETPGIQTAKIKVLGSGRVIFERKIEILQRSIYAYKVNAGTTYKIGHPAVIKITKRKIDNSQIDKFGYKLEIDNPEGTKVQYLDSENKYLDAKREVDDKGSYVADLMPIENLVSRAASHTATITIDSSEEKMITVTIYDLVNYADTAIAKKTIKFLK